MAGRWKWYTLILLAIIAMAGTFIWFFIWAFSEPTFRSVDDFAPSDVTRLEVRLFNLRTAIPQSGDGETVPDMIGPFNARSDDIAELLGLLKGAKPVPEMAAGSYAAQFEIHLKKGKPQRIRVKFSVGKPGKPETFRVWYRIADGLEFEASCSALQLVDAVLKAERKAKGQ